MTRPAHHGFSSTAAKGRPAVKADDAERIYAWLAREIRAGKHPAPSWTELAERFSMGPERAKRIIHALEAEGRIKLKHQPPKPAEVALA